MTHSRGAAEILFIAIIFARVTTGDPQYDERYSPSRATTFDYSVPAETSPYYRDQPSFLDKGYSPVNVILGPSTPGSVERSFGSTDIYTPSNYASSYLSPSRNDYPSQYTSTPSSAFNRAFNNRGYISIDTTPATQRNQYPEFLLSPRKQNFQLPGYVNKNFDPSLIERDAFAPKRSRRPFRLESGPVLNEPSSEPLLLDTPNNIPGFSVNSPTLPDFLSEVKGQVFGSCAAPTLCRPSKYRTIDGSCNNLRNPMWGAARTPYGRLLPPKYSDGYHAPPVSVTGQELPEARLLSRMFLPPALKDDPIWTLLSMQWGQIMTHDMSLGMDTIPSPNNPACCAQNGILFGRLSKGEPCFPIPIQQDDPMFIKYQQSCMDFLRTTTDAQAGCPMGKPAKPLTQESHWLDGSTVYASDPDVTRTLRSGQGGKLRAEIRQGQEWPPSDFNSSSCPMRPPEQVCYKTGDVRVNQNPQLALLQVVLLREHNRIAESLQKVNPHWNDENLFQEARRILIAEIQHISYYEWLPIFLGKRTVKEHGLVYEGFYNYVDDYDPNVNPSVLNEHSQAAFRFFHTLIQGNLLLMSEKRFSLGHILLPENMNDPSILEAGVFDDLTRGLTTQPQHAPDRFHSIEILENLFRRPENPTFGFDLKATDIHRARDHGIASYNDYRQYCGFKRASKFKDFADLIEPSIVERLEKVYQHPDDVDLAVGATVEELANDALVGPTFLCILKQQFYRTRVGDQFFFEHGKHKGAFTPDQLNELRKSNIARLMCDNSDNVLSMQPKAFKKISKKNPLVPCADLETIPIVNLEAWRDISLKHVPHQSFSG